jgi:ribosomal subunit interface protein
MSFPTITFKHTNLEPDYVLQKLITSKLSALQKYLAGARDIKVEVELEKLAAHVQGPICRIEANIWRGAKLSRAEAVADTFEKAIDEVRANLDHELERAHDKRVSVWRRSARRVKEMMRFSR